MHPESMTGSLRTVENRFANKILVSSQISCRVGAAIPSALTRWHLEKSQDSVLDTEQTQVSLECAIKETCRQFPFTPRLR
jgi:hypothetical protein